MPKIRHNIKPMIHIHTRKIYIFGLVRPNIHSTFWGKTPRGLYFEEFYLHYKYNTDEEVKIRIKY